MFINGLSPLNVPSDFIIYQQTNSNEDPKFVFVPEDHENKEAIQKAAAFIEENYQEGDLIVVENCLTRSEVDQKTFRSTKNISKKVRVIGSDTEGDSIDGYCKPGTIYEEYWRSSAILKKQFEFASSQFNDLRNVLGQILNTEIINKFNKNAPDIDLQNTKIYKLILDLQQSDEINFFKEPKIYELFVSLMQMVEETKIKIDQFNSLDDWESSIPDFYEDIAQIGFAAQALNCIESLSDKCFIHTQHDIDSKRIVLTFREREECKIETLDYVKSVARRIFMVWGMNHFVEGKDAAAYPQMRLDRFYEWIKDKPCVIVGPKIV